MTPGELAIIRHIEEDAEFGNPTFVDELDPISLTTCATMGWVLIEGNEVWLTEEGSAAAANEGR